MYITLYREALFELDINLVDIEKTKKKKKKKKKNYNVLQKRPINRRKKL